MTAMPNVRRTRLPYAALAVLTTLAWSCKDSSGPDKPGPAADIAISAGNGQSGVAGDALVAPIATKVSDANGRGVPNAAVTFQTLDGAGTVTPTTTRTNGAGIATATWTLPTFAGTAAKARAVLIDTLTGALVDSVTFSATVRGGPAASMQWLPTQPLAPAGSQESVSVTLFDSYGNRSSGATVNWAVTAGSGSVNPTTSVADANGVASATWTLGSAAGNNRLTARSGTATAEFATEGRVAGQPESMVGGPTPGAAPLGGVVPLTVTVYDAFGIRVAGATVNWTVTAGSGSLSDASTVTNSNGTTTVNATLGSAAGVNSFRATAGNATLSFSIEGRVMTDRLTYTAGPAFGIARTAAGTFVVSDIGYGTVEIFSESSPGVKQSVGTGGTPVVVAVDAAGDFAYVSNMDGWLDIIGISAHSIVNRVPIPNAHALALSPGGDRVYVTATDGWVVAVNTLTRKVVDSVAVPNGPWGIAFRTTATDSLMYVTARDGATITEVDTKTLTVLRTFSVGGRPHGLTISPDGQTLYAADNSQGRVLAVNTTSGLVTNTVSIPGAFGIAISPDGSTLFVTTDNGKAAVITASTLTVTKLMETGNQARQVIVAPDGATAWAADEGGWVDIIKK
jgi:YVTN family beta-propeller protein